MDLRAELASMAKELQCTSWEFTISSDQDHDAPGLKYLGHFYATFEDGDESHLGLWINNNNQIVSY